MPLYIENKDYQLVPVEDVNNTQGWDVRFLTGEYAETVIRYGNVSVDGKADQLTFNFVVITSPIDDLDPDKDVDLQQYSADILTSIIEDSIENKSLVIRDKGTPIEQINEQ